MKATVKATFKAGVQNPLRKFLKIGLLITLAAVVSSGSSNAYGVNYSLTINSARSKNVSVTEGNAVTFAVSASSSPSARLYYQWYYHSQRITGATSPSYTIPAAKYADVLGGSGLYACNVSTSPSFSSLSGNQSKMSDAIMLSVSKPQAPKITAQPQPITVNQGGKAELVVRVSDASGVSYQWKKNGLNVGANSNVLFIGSAQPSDQGAYTVVATSKGGSVTSSPANLTVKTPALPVTIVNHPVSLSVQVGREAKFSVGVSDETGVTYQWRKNGVPIAGATAKTFSIVASRLTDSGTYTVRVSNSAGPVDSKAANLSVKAASAVLIVKQPSSLNVEVGQKAEFTVQPSSENGVTYQWEKDGVPIAGAKSKTFSIASVKISDKGVYAVIVCDASGCTPSLGATLGVKSTTASGWTENFTDAKTRASTLKRHLLLNFTGSDWCGWCIKLDSEVFSKPEFKSLADSNLVLAKIDFPRTRSQDLAIKSQNQGLLSTYNVTGFPTLILLDSSGKEVKRWRGFSSQFLAELKKQIGAGNASSGAGDAAFAARVAAYPVPSDSKLRDSYDLLMSVWKMKPHWTNPPLPPSETGLSASIQYIYAVSSWIATNARNDGDTQIADYYADFALQAQKQYEALTPR